jgi:hypothetical protein
MHVGSQWDLNIKDTVGEYIREGLSNARVGDGISICC